jgi:hypothetical protein
LRHSSSLWATAKVSAATAGLGRRQESVANAASAAAPPAPMNKRLVVVMSQTSHRIAE